MKCRRGHSCVPLLFDIFTYDLNDNVVNLVSKFDTKIGGIVDSNDRYLYLRQDLDHLGRCAKEWQTEFNSDKCRVLPFCLSNQGSQPRDSLGLEAQVIGRG